MAKLLFLEVLFLVCYSYRFPEDMVSEEDGLGFSVKANGTKKLGLTLHKASPLKVAFAVFITDVGTGGWKDAIDMLAFGANKAIAKSKHKIDLVALSPETLAADKEQALLKAGFKAVYRKPVPVPPESMLQGEAREHMSRVMGKADAHNEFLMAHETVKYWGLALTQYDRALVIDADVMVLDPMDELMERAEDFIGTYDHGLDVDFSTMPPTQGGFLLYRPNMADFDAVNALTKSGAWSGGGWNNSGIGWCYGGVGPDGLLSYYFNKDALETIKQTGKKYLPEGIAKPKIIGSRMLAVDRSIYDVVLNQRLRDELAEAGGDHDKVISGVKSVHFTGDCVKPWTCFETSNWFCEGLLKKWWDLRGELEDSRGIERTSRGSNCKNGVYKPISA